MHNGCRDKPPGGGLHLCAMRISGTYNYIYWDAQLGMLQGCERENSCAFRVCGTKANHNSTHCAVAPAGLRPSFEEPLVEERISGTGQDTATGRNQRSVIDLPASGGLIDYYVAVVPTIRHVIDNQNASRPWTTCALEI